MMEDYCPDSAVWKRVVNSSVYNDPEYAAPVVIECQKEEKIRLVRNKFGVQVVSDTTLRTVSHVEIDDLIDDRVVISVLTMKDLDGEIEGYEVML
jgi:hypothetical protein